MFCWWACSVGGGLLVVLVEYLLSVYSDSVMGGLLVGLSAGGWGVLFLFLKFLNYFSFLFSEFVKMMTPK